MNIYGKKTVLRALTGDDSAMLVELVNDPQTENMIGGKSYPVSFEEQCRWMEGQSGRTDILRCIVADRNLPGEGLGTVILGDIDHINGTAQVHIKMDAKKGRGKGYGLDALKTLTGYAFDEMRLNCIYAVIASYNKPSIGLFEKAGFMREGELRSRLFKKGSYHSCYMYSVIKKDSNPERDGGIVAE